MGDALAIGLYLGFILGVFLSVREQSKNNR